MLLCNTVIVLSKMVYIGGLLKYSSYYFNIILFSVECLYKMNTDNNFVYYRIGRCTLMYNVIFHSSERYKAGAYLVNISKQKIFTKNVVHQ